MTAGVLRDYLLAVQQLLKFPSTREGLLLVRPQMWWLQGAGAVAMGPQGVSAGTRALARSLARSLARTRVCCCVEFASLCPVSWPDAHTWCQAALSFVGLPAACSYVQSSLVDRLERAVRQGWLPEDTLGLAVAVLHDARGLQEVAATA
jgi:hypothetical protein